LTETVGVPPGTAGCGRVLGEDTPLIGFTLIAIEYHLGCHEAVGTFDPLTSQVEVYLYHVWVLKIFLREDFRDLGAPH
jgi:hypothetical protein